MLLKRISTSKPVNGLHDDTSRLLFSWAIPHLDSAGRIHGDPCVFRSTVAPRLAHITDEVAERCMREWSEAKLVLWYEKNGDKWLEFPGFLDNQPGLRTDREAPSDIPAPDGCRSNSGVTPLEGNGREEKRSKEKGAKRTYAPNVLLTEEEHEALVKQYGSDVVTLAIEKLDAYKLEKGKHYKSDAGALRSWGIQAALEQREKTRGKGGASPTRSVSARKCPKCGEENRHTGSMCLKCGEELRKGKEAERRTP